VVDTAGLLFIFKLNFEFKNSISGNWQGNENVKRASLCLPAGLDQTLTIELSLNSLH
jgi:hypothetical protein